MAMKKTVLIRLAGETHYSKHIELDFTQLTNILKFPKDVFADVDGVRISIKRDEFEQLIEEYEVENNMG
jgi:methyl coenzyme M reductase subunit C-like uncharacterized protein (methanogenesis marker protein 7)